MSESTVNKRAGSGIFAKLMIGFLFVISFTVLGDCYFFTQMNRLADLTTKIYNHPLQVTRAVLSADTNIVKIHRNMKDVALARNDKEIEEAIRLVNSYEKIVYSHLEIVEEWILGEEGASLQKETENLFRDWKPIRDEVIALTKTGNIKDAYAITRGKGADHVERLNLKMEELKNYAASKASGMLHDSQSTRVSVVRTTTILIITIIVTALVFGFFFSRTITNSVNSIINGIQEFTRGNLEFEIDIESKDELSWIANALNEMAYQRKKTLDEISLQSEILKNMAEGVYLIRVEDGIIVHTNPKFEDLFSYESGEMNGLHSSIVNAPTEKAPEERSQEIMQEIGESGSWSGEVCNIRKDGTTFWCNANVSLFDHPVYGKVMISAHTDISKRKLLESELMDHKNQLEETVKERTKELEEVIQKQKQTELALRQSELALNDQIAELNHIYKVTPVGLCFMSPDMKFVRINEIMAEINGKTVAEHINRSIEDVIPELAEQVVPVYNQVIETGQAILNFEVNGITRAKPDVQKNWLVSYYPVYKESKELLGVGTVVVDVTDQKQAEEEIKSSLKEKETLLLEIHHRVKNNMQVISSLLKLQSNSLDDDKVKSALLESQNRVRAMASVHQNLYKSENLSSISILPFIKELVESTLSSYQTSSDKISLEFYSDEVFISIDQATPIGLIVNELVSNSLKYAFPDGHNGIIQITIKRKEDGIHLDFADDGIGIPKTIDWRNSDSLGLQLVVNLIENQLQGTVTLNVENGTRFSFVFEEKNRLKG